MSIWKEIKKAINSTLGTSDFKPIDKMLQMKIFKSDNVLVNIGNIGFLNDTRTVISAIPADGASYWFKELKFDVNGKAQINIRFNNVGVKLKFQHNNTVLEKTLTSQQYNSEININKGDVVKFYLYSTTNGEIAINSFDLLGTLAPESFIQSYNI